MRTILAQDLGEINKAFNPPFFSGAEKYSEAKLSVVIGEAEHSKGPCPFTRKSLEGFDANSGKTENSLVFSEKADALFGSPRGETSRSCLKIEHLAVSDKNLKNDANEFPYGGREGKRLYDALLTKPKIKKKVCKSVQQCGAISFSYWKKNGAREIMVKRFVCGSWRCPYCAIKVAQRDYVRIKKAVLDNPGQWLFSVFTFNPKEYSDSNKAYDAISSNMGKLLKRMRREFGRELFIQTVEQHAKGWPHVNMIFKFKDKTFVDEKDVEKFRARWLVPNAKDCGFGKIVSCELAYGDASGVADYIAKTGLRMVGEIAKESQVPINSPIGTRRLRSTQGLLAPIAKGSGEFTGAILKNHIDDLKNVPENLFIETMSRKFDDLDLVDKVSIVGEEIDSTKVLPLVSSKSSEDFRVKGLRPSECSASPMTTLSSASLYFPAPLKNASQDICSSA
jgi:hypothetical protein